MTNHSETTGSSENGDINGRGRRDGRGGDDGRDGRASCDGGPASSVESGLDGPTASISHVPYGGDSAYEGTAVYGGNPAAHQVTLRTPAELADALPYLLGYRPEDSIVLVALHDRGGRGRFGGRARLGIPTHPDDWAAVAQQLAEGLVKGSERRGARPAEMVAYLCQEPGKGETGRQVMERLQPLAQHLRLACGGLDVPVIEALCIADGRFWSYCCASEGCCPVEGVPMGLPGTSVLAAAATYAGIQVRGTLRELRARLLPLETGLALEQEACLDVASRALVPRILDDASRAVVAEETVELAGRVMRRFAEAPRVSGAVMADRGDDELLGYDEAAALILGLQDRVTRDRAAQWMEGDEAAPALRLWRALARRCVGPYGEHAAAPLTLAGWVAWSSGDELEAREALAMALGADPGYLFARLLHQACNEGLDPESVRRCLRSEREEREAAPEGHETQEGSEAHRQSAGEACGGTAAVPGLVDAEGADALGGSGEVRRGGSPVDRKGADCTDEVHELAEPSPAPSPASSPAPPPEVGRRRRRIRSAGVACSPARAQTPEGDETEGRVPGAGALRAHSSTARTTRPAAASRGGSRPRSAGKASARRSHNCQEGVRSDGDDVGGKG